MNRIDPNYNENGIDPEVLLKEDINSVKLANKLRQEMYDSPYQSNFKVLALLFVRSNNEKLLIIKGANYEQGYIGGAICAERAAISNLRFIFKPRVEKVVVVTDSDDPISPGSLCREFLLSVSEPDTPVVMGNSTSEKISVTSLGYLYPLPYIYRYVGRKNLEEFASLFSKKCNLDTSSLPKEAQIAYDKAVNNKKLDLNFMIHPINYSTCVYFNDNCYELANFIKGIEYGCSIDPVVQMIHFILKRMEKAPEVYPIFIVTTDQYGVAHAPFAQARSLLLEHGLGFLKVIVHNHIGEFEIQPVVDLLPQLKDAKLLSHDEFV